MPRITIMIEGEAEEMVEWLERVKRFSRGLREPSPSAAPPDWSWTEPHMRQLWEHLRPSARAILKELATQPEGYPFFMLKEKLGLQQKERVLPGLLSSLGFALRRLSFPAPLERDYRTKQWRMPPEVATLIGQMPAEVHSIRVKKTVQLQVPGSTLTVVEVAKTPMKHRRQKV